MVCCSVCFVSRMRSLMNISLQPHGASQQSQRLCPSTATSSCTEKSSPSCCWDQLPSEVALFPFSFQTGRHVRATGARAPRPCGVAWGWGWPPRACLSELPVSRLVQQPEDVGSEGQGLEVVFRHLQRSAPPASSADFQFVPIRSADR